MKEVCFKKEEGNVTLPSNTHFRFGLKASAPKEKRRFLNNFSCSFTTYPNNLSDVTGMVVKLPWEYVLLVFM